MRVIPCNERARLCWLRTRGLGMGAVVAFANLRAKPIVRPTYLSGQGRLPILPRAGWGWSWRSTLPRKGSRSAQDRARPRAVDRRDRVRTAGDRNAAFRQVRVRRQELLRPVS